MYEALEDMEKFEQRKEKYAAVEVRRLEIEENKALIQMNPDSVSYTETRWRINLLSSDPNFVYDKPYGLNYKCSEC